MSDFPTRPDQFSTEWLASILGAAPGSLRDLDYEPVGTGQMCDSFRLRLVWHEGADGPGSVIAKCPSRDEASRQVAGLLRLYAVELGWYRDLSGDVEIRCPAVYHARIADNGIDFVLLLEDCAPAAQGDQLRGGDLQQIEAAVLESAALHAPFWGRAEALDWPWLRFGEQTAATFRAGLPALYQGFRERYAARLPAEILAMGEEFVARFARYSAYQPAAPTLVHGDYRVDNLLFYPGDPRPVVVDWQTVGIGSGLADVAYLLGTSIADPAVRAAEERRLVSRYVAALGERGVEADPALCWEEYRRYAFAGFMMAVFASANVERTERGDEMFALMAERPARQVLDLDSMSLLY
jgi:hypothetical protein